MRRGILIFFAYLVATIWLTWPLGAHLGSRLPCTSHYCGADTLYSVWVLSYGSHALASADASLLGGNVFHPETRSVLYGPTGFGALPYFAPLDLLTGNPVLAMNLVLLLCTALTATFLHVLAWSLAGTHAAGVVAAVVLLTSRWVLFGFVASAPHLVALQYFPLIMLLAACSPPEKGMGRGSSRQVREGGQEREEDCSISLGALGYPCALGERIGQGGASWAALMLVLVLLQCSTELVYVALAVLVPLGVIALIRIAEPRTRAQGLWLAGVVVVTPLLLAPLYLAYASVRGANPQLREQTTWQTEMPTDLGAIFWTHYSPLATSTAVLLLIAAGAAVALRRGSVSHGPRRFAWRHGALWTAVGVAISIAPSLHWGPVAIATPQDLLESLTPLYEVIRAPTRLGVAGLMGICLLAGAAWAELCALLLGRVGARTGAGDAGASHAARTPATARTSHAAHTSDGTHASDAPRTPRTAVARVATLALLAAIYLTPPLGGRRIPFAYPLQEPPPVPQEFLAPLRAGDGPLLVLPALAASGKPDILMNARAMYQSAYHWRPLVNGYSSYWPRDYLPTLDLARRLPDAAALAELRSRTGVTTVWVDLTKLPAERAAAWESVAQQPVGSGLVPVARAGDQLLLTVEAQQLQPASEVR